LVSSTSARDRRNRKVLDARVVIAVLATISPSPSQELPADAQIDDLVLCRDTRVAGRLRRAGRFEHGQVERRQSLDVSYRQVNMVEAGGGTRSRPSTRRRRRYQHYATVWARSLPPPRNPRTAAVMQRTSGALLLSHVEASVAEFRRQTLAPDDQQKPARLD
jgi:hypothetical protein